MNLHRKEPDTEQNHMQVYLCEEDIEDANVVMEIDYVQREYNENYDICDNPEKFELHVDGEVIN